MCNLFGGPSAQEEQIGAQSKSFSGVLDSNYQKTFGQQQDVLQQLQQQVHKIATGDTGEGFSAAENADREAMITNNAAASERNATQANQNETAGMNINGMNDSSGLARAAGTRRELAGDLSAFGEINKSNELMANKALNYATGRQNAITAAGGLESLAGQYGSSAGLAADQGVKENTQAFDQAKTIEQQQQQKSAAIAGLITKGITSAATFGMGGMANLDTTGGSSMGEQFGNIFSGGMDALSNGLG